MAVITRKVILNHSMNYLIRDKADIKLDLGDTELNRFGIKLMVQFCKKYNLMYHLYLSSTRMTYNSGNFMDFGYHLVRPRMGERMPLKGLQIAQLWRLFLLEALENNQKHDVLLLLPNLKYTLEVNGFRESEEIEELFAKHNLINRHINYSLN